MRTALFLLVTILSFVSSVQASACSTEDKLSYSMSLYLGSAHSNIKPSDRINETNPGIGLGKHVGCGFLGAEYSMSASFLKNTMSGRTGALSLEAVWKVPVNDGYYIPVGWSLSYLEYENARDGTSYKGMALFPFFGIGKGNTSLRIAVLLSDPLLALNGKGQGAFLFFVHHEF